MINLRKQRQKFSRNSLMLNASSDQALIQIKVNSDCFKGQDVDELNSKDALMIYNFLCSLLAYGLRTLTTDGSRLANIVVLVDSERVPVKVLRVILRACQNALAYKIKHAIVIEPDRFLDQQRISLDILLEAYDFKTTMCSRSKIWKYVDSTSLYHNRPSFGQLLSGWTDIKKKFEDHFYSNPGYFATDTSTSCVTFLAKFLKKDQSVMIELANESRKLPEPKVLLQEERLQINSDDEDTEISAVAKDKPETSAQLERDKETEIPEHIIEVLKERMARIKELIDWIEGPCEQCFESFKQVCKSVSEVQRLESRYSDMITEFRDIKEKATELFESVSFLRNSTDGLAYDPAMQLSLHLNELLHTVQKRMEHAAEKLEYLKKFHSIASELYEEADTFVGALCSDPKNLELATLKSELRKLDYKIKLIEKRFEAAVETCTKFCSSVKDEQPNATEQPAEVVYLSEQLSNLNERRRRCLGLADIRRLKVQQFIQLLTCEEDAQQAIDWIKELQQNAHAGDPITKITKFEDVAKKMEKYCDQLCEVSLLLRRSLRLEVQPQIQLQQNLQLAYSLFNDTVKLLKIHQPSFYMSSK